MTERSRTLHGFVSGRVQGVFFRAETRIQATALGLSGWVRNLPDGRVEVLISGPESAIEAMRKWLARGPAGARVDVLMLEESGLDAGSEFVVTR